MRSTFDIVVGSDSDSDGASVALVSLEALKLELGISGTTEDDLNLARIDRQSRLIAEQCERRFAFGTAIETFIFETCEQTRDGGGLPLRLYPIGEISSVTADGAELGDSDFFFEDENGLLFRSNSGRWSGTVVVTYSGGYQLPDDAPARLAQACIEAVRAKRFSATRDPGVRDVSHGDASVSYFQEASASGESGLPQIVLDLIKPYRRLTAY